MSYNDSITYAIIELDTGVPYGVIEIGYPEPVLVTEDGTFTVEVDELWPGEDWTFSPDKWRILRAGLIAKEADEALGYDADEPYFSEPEDWGIDEDET